MSGSESPANRQSSMVHTFFKASLSVCILGYLFRRKDKVTSASKMDQEIGVWAYATPRWEPSHPWFLLENFQVPLICYSQMGQQSEQKSIRMLWSISTEPYPPTQTISIFKALFRQRFPSKFVALPTKSLDQQLSSKSTSRWNHWRLLLADLCSYATTEGDKSSLLEISKLGSILKAFIKGLAN